jgi:Caspase domain
VSRKGTREALIVAVSEYEDPNFRRLRAPAADAKELADVLRDPDIAGFQVDVLTNPDERELRRRLATFFGTERRPEDLLVVHFSCHGIKDASGELYLAASDTDKDLLDATGIQSAWLNQRLNRCRSKRIVVLLDCCYSGSFPFGTHVRADEDVNAPAHFEGHGRAVITASSSMEYAYEGDQLTTDKPKPSVFTEAVVQGLRTGEADRDHDKRVSIQDLYDYVFERIHDTTPEQTPNMMSTLEGPLYIARSSYEPPVEPAELDKHLLDLTEHPVPEARLGAVNVLTRLLASSNKSVALTARLTLERMVNDDSKRVAESAQAALTQLAMEQQEGRREAEDRARHEAEEEARREAEEEARREAEEEARREAEEEARREARRHPAQHSRANDQSQRRSEVEFRGLPFTPEAAFELVRVRPGITLARVAELFGIPRRDALEVLTKLRLDGLVEWRGLGWYATQRRQATY